MRQPTAATSQCASGGSANVPSEPPVEATPTARPRRRANHFTTVLLQGT